MRCIRRDVNERKRLLAQPITFSPDRHVDCDCGCYHARIDSDK